MTRALVVGLLTWVAASLFANGAAAEQAWRSIDCSKTGIVLPGGKSGNCAAGPIEREQGCIYDTYAVGAGPVPGPRFRVERKVGRDATHMCGLQGPNTVASMKSRAGVYVERQAVAFSDLQSVDDDRTLILFFKTKDPAHDGDCFAFEKREGPQGIGYRNVLTGFFCAGGGHGFDLAAARAVLQNLRSTF